MLTLLKSRNVESSPTPMFTHAVADGEDPAVAGQRVPVAVLDVERGLDPRLGVAGRLPVRADGRAVRPLLGPEGAEGAAEAAVGAVGHHDVASPQLDGFRPVGGLDDRAAHEATVDHRRDRVGALEQGRPRRLGVQRHHPVEVAAAHDVAVAREDGVLGPRAAPATAPARCSAGRRSGGTWSAPRPGPCPASCLTARGVRPSPQVFSRGNVLRSTTVTSWPWRASQ